MINIAENRKYYVYEWYLESTGEVFHVGKGCGNRFKEKRAHRNDYFQNVISKHGDDAKSRIVIDNLTEQEAWDKEKELIAQYKAIGQCKTNLHEGGHGGYTGNYDNPERSRKISEARKKAPSKRGPENPLYGRHLSEEHKQKISQSLKGIAFTEEHKAKIGEASKRNWTPEMQEKLLEGRLKKLETLTPEEKFKFVDHLCHYEYQVYFHNELVYSSIGYEKLIEFCKENYNISRTIVEKLIKQQWKPTFNKHKWLESLQIIRTKRCID